MTAITPRPIYSKIDAVGEHLHAAGVLFLSNSFPAATHTLVAAARQVMWDIGKSKNNSVVSNFKKFEEDRVRPGMMKEWRRYAKRPANFLKHGDLDPTDTLDDVDFDKLNSIELLMTLLAYSEERRSLTLQLNILLIVVSQENADVFNYSGLFGAVPAVVEFLEELSALPKLGRRARALEIFQHV